MNTNPSAKTILCYGDSSTWGQKPDKSGRFTADARWTGSNDKKQLSPLNVFDWYFKPHVNFKTWKAKDMGFPYHAVDDQIALKVVDGKVEVVSEGKWELVS